MKNIVKIYVDADKTKGRQEHSWRFIGYDECNYTYTPDGMALLKKFGALGDAPYYFRTHFMFCTGNSQGTYKFGSTNVYREDENGQPVYDFTYYDKIIDAFIKTGNKPFVELGFMPMDMADKNYMLPVYGRWDIYNQYKDKGWSCPPKDYGRWHEFIQKVISHLVERYGAEEVVSWYFELWNEPDIFYWQGTAAEYCKLFDYTEHAVHEVLQELRLSGPSVTGMFAGGFAESFFRFFLEHCRYGTNYFTQEKGTRLDFITFHVKGGSFQFEQNAPKAVPSVEKLVHQVKLGLDIIREYGYQNRELVLSEADPDGWAAGCVYDNENMVFRNTEYYASFTASCYDKIQRLSERYQIAIRPLAWAFLFPGERCFEGTRAFTTQGIDKAVFNLFKIYSSLGTEKLRFESDGENKADYLELPEFILENPDRYTGEGEDIDVSGFAVKGIAGETQVVVYSHCNDRDNRESQEISLTVAGIGTERVRISHYRIDESHSNPYNEWIRQGKPLFPSGKVYEAIKARDCLEQFCGDTFAENKDGRVSLVFEMPAHGVSYLVIRAEKE